MTPEPAPPRTRHQVTYAVIAVGVVSFVMLQSMVNPVLPTLERALGTTQADVTWVLTANFLSAAVCTPILGRLGDMVGKKRVFVAALAALAVGSLLAGLADSLTVMIVARLIQGAGGGVLPLAFGIIRDEFPRDRVPGAVGTISSLMAVGGAIGLVVAGPIVDGLGHRWLFFLPFVAVSLAAVGAHLVIPESRARTGGSVNLVAALLLSGWLVCLLLSVSRAPQWGWGSPAVVGMLVGGAVLLVVWITAESRARQPLIDMRMMRIRGVWTANVVAVLFGAAMFAGFAFLPQYMQTPEVTGYGLGASISAAGFVLLPQSGAAFVTGLSSGRLVARFGSKRILVAGALSCSAGFCLLAFVHDSLWQIALSGIPMGIGFGLAFSAMANLVVAAVPSSQTGVASGMNANLRTIGGAIGTALLAGVVTADLQATTGLPAESSYRAAFLLAAGGLLLAALAGLLVPAVRRDPGGQREPEPPLRHPQGGVVPAATAVADGPERSSRRTCTGTVQRSPGRD